MSWLKRLSFTFLLVVTMVSMAFSPGAPSLAADEAGSHFVRLPATELAEIGKLDLRPIRTIDYGSFLWLELDEAGFASLRASGRAYTEVIDAGVVSFNQVRFDPRREGEPRVAPELTADEKEQGFHLVQLAGPVKDEWLLQLQSSGLKILQYYPHNAYLVWATPEQANAAKRLQEVRWSGLFHPAYKINADLQARSGWVRNIDIVFYNDGDVASTLQRLASLGARVLQAYPSQPDKAFYDAIVEMDAAMVPAVARIGSVLWLGYSSPEPVLDDEMSSQINAGNYTAGVPFTGYTTWLGDRGVNGAGVTWAIIDTGIDYNHPDLGSHIVGGYNFPGACSVIGQPGSDCPDGGHGTHVAGIVGGNAAAGFSDANGFLYGMGVAPAVSFFAMNSLSGTAWPPAGGWQEHSKRALLGNAIGGNNSWTTGEGTAHGYQASERTHDQMVRDGNFDTASVAEPFIEVFSAGNSGPGAQTLTAPKEAKNLIVVASSRNYRVGSIDSISSFSSRGPAVDGRYVPTITTPGEEISSSRNDTGGDCSTSIPGTNNLYAFCSGTSMASPHASGSVALITQWWRGFHGNANPSPAMAKALLVNGAVDLGAADIPNFNEGWGRVNLSNVINNGVDMVYYDQTSLFHNTGETWSINVGVSDPTKPLKVSLAWSDALGAIGANPALVNNLDLTVVNGSSTYLGNRFSAGWSATGGSPDALNNLENVFIQNPAGSATITIQATNLPGDGVPYNGDATDQDFALVCYNCAEFPDFTLSAAPDSQSVCAPAIAGYSVDVGSVLGYADPVTLSALTQPASALSTSFNANAQVPPYSSLLTLGNTGAAAAGDYDVIITGTAPTSTHTITQTLSLFNALPGNINLQTPADGALNQPIQPVFTWDTANQAATYNIQIATDNAFSNVVDSASGLTGSTYSPAISLNTSATYFWRVWAVNACGVGDSSATRSFTTEAAPGDCPVGTLPVVAFSDDFESGAAGWTHSGTGDTWALDTARKHSGAFSYHALDSSSVTDQRLVSPQINLPVGQSPLTLKFWNYQAMENRSGGCYDGGILEISTNSGETWSQIVPPALLTDPYDGLVGNTTSNPLSGLNAWCGNPQDWINSVIDLNAYAGQPAQFRFRLGTDSSVGYEGWYLDDVVVQSCVPATYNASLGPNSELDGVPGSVVIHSFTLANLGLPDSYTLTVSGPTWPTVLLTPSPVVVAGQTQAQVNVQVQVPEGMPLQEVLYGTDVFTLTAQSVGDPDILLSAQGTTNSAIHPGVNLTPLAFSRSGLPGEVVTHTLSIQNSGDYTDTFSLSVEGNLWPASYPASSGPLGVGSSIIVEIPVTIPDQVPDTIIATDTLTITAVSSIDGLVSSQAQRTTNANVTPGVDITADLLSKAGLPGEIITYTYRITNTGDYTDSFAIHLSGNQWPVTAPAQTGWLGVGSSQLVDIGVHIPTTPALEAVIASDAFVIQAVSYWDNLVTAASSGTTQALANPALSLSPSVESLAGLPGEVVTHTFTITNQGDYTDTFSLAISGSSWPTQSPPQTASLPPGAGQQVLVSVEIPIAPAPEAAQVTISDTFTLQAFSHWDPGVSATASGTTSAEATAQVHLGEDQNSSAVVGTYATYSFQVSNLGNYADTYTLSVSSAWPTELSSITTGLVLPGESAAIIVRVAVPGTAAELTSDTAILTAVSGLDGSVSDTARITTTAFWLHIYLPRVAK